jgi:hypothetical protein
MSTTECYDEKCGGGCGCKSCDRAQNRKKSYQQYGFSEDAADSLVFGQQPAALGYPTPTFGPEVMDALNFKNKKKIKNKEVANYSEDVEADMAMARIDVMRGRLDELAMKLGPLMELGEVEMDVWMHDKLTLAADYISAVADAALYGGGIELEIEEEDVKMYGEGKRSDYPDVDKDGNRKESMESALKNAKAKKAKAKKAGIKIS